MKVTLDSLVPGVPFAVKFNGEEAWLESLYALYPAPAGSLAPKLQGSVELTLWDDFVRVSGTFSYAPFVDCGRCALSIPWSLASAVIEQNYQLQAPSELPKELDLNSEDLDLAYLEKGEVDLERVLREAIDWALPTVTSPAWDEGGRCTVCFEDVSDPCVFSSDGTKGKAPNPFAKLRQLKL